MEHHHGILSLAYSHIIVICALALNIVDDRQLYMIDNVRGDNDKTPPPSGSQHLKLHTIYSTRPLPRNFGKMTF